MQKNKHIVGWEAVFQIYPLNNFIKSIWKPCCLLICSYVLFVLSDKSAFEMIGYVSDKIISIYPSVVGFVLTGYALMIGLSDTQLVKAMCQNHKGSSKPSMFQVVNATFVVILLSLLSTLLAGFVSNWLIALNISLCYMTEVLKKFVNHTALLLLLFLVYYSLFALFDVIINIFNFGQFANVFESKR